MSITKRRRKDTGMPSFFQRNKGKIIGYPIAAVVIVALIFLARYFGREKEKVIEELPLYSFGELSKDPITLDNGIVSLVFDPTTTHFVFTDKNKHKWFSDSQAEDTQHTELNALLMITYQDSKGEPKKYDSDKWSVQLLNYNYSWDPDDYSITINYTIGNVRPTYYVPRAITQERFDEIYAQLKPEHQKEFKKSYTFMDAKNLAKSINDKYKKSYPKIVDDVMNNGVTVALIRDNTPDWKLKKFADFLAEDLGYTPEDWNADQEKYSEGESGTKDPSVNVTLVLKLDGEDLVATVPYDKIQYRSQFPLTEVSILPYMTSEAQTSTGSLFVPDGSGALIHFNNQKGRQEYSAKIYGQDIAMVQNYKMSEITANFPIYGIMVESRQGDDSVGNGQSLLAIVESGDSYGVIKAGTPSGANVNVNYVSSRFTVLHNDKVDVGARSTTSVYAYEDKLNPEENISIRFRPIDGCDYVNMAKEYRNYYLAKYPELKAQASTDVPVAVELVGAVTKTQHVLGFPADRPYAVTTYSQMADIVKDLNSNGLENMNVVLTGWFNEGVKHEVADDVDLISALGGKSAFKKAISSIQGSNQLYLKANFTFVYEDEWFDSFRYRRDTAKYVSREYVKLQKFSDVWYGVEDDADIYYLANPAYIEKTIKAYADELEDLGLKNIAFSDVGNKLAADYNRKKAVSREQAKSGQTDLFKSLQSDGTKLVFYDPFEYAVAQSSLLLNVDVDSSHFSLADEAIPFFPIVFHGYLDYMGDALNITGNFVNNLLKTVESGAGLYYTFIASPAMELAETENTDLFGAHYDSWKDDAIKYYQRFKKDFAGLYNQTIEDHEIIDRGITMTQYADGTKVYVNYRSTAYQIDGKEIPAEDWIVVKGGN